MEFINNRNNYKSDLHLDNQIATACSKCGFTKWVRYSVSPAFLKKLCFGLHSKLGQVLVFLYHNVHVRVSEQLRICLHLI